MTFGVDQAGVDVTASAITIDDELRPSFRLHSPWGEADVRLDARRASGDERARGRRGRDGVRRPARERGATGLASATLSPWRMDLQRTARGVLVLNDAYNANPTSMEAALRALARLPARRRIAVVGVMAELGPSGQPSIGASRSWLTSSGSS